MAQLMISLKNATTNSSSGVKRRGLPSGAQGRTKGAAGGGAGGAGGGGVSGGQPVMASAVSSLPSVNAEPLHRLDDEGRADDDMTEDEAEDDDAVSAADSPSTPNFTAAAMNTIKQRLLEHVQSLVGGHPLCEHLPPQVQDAIIEQVTADAEALVQEHVWEYALLCSTPELTPNSEAVVAEAVTETIGSMPVQLELSTLSTLLVTYAHLRCN